MESGNIWGSLENATPSVMVENRKTLSVNNLRIYLAMTPTQEINKDTFFDYFRENSLQKPLEGTEYYLPHALFHYPIEDEKILAIMDFLFDYTSPYVLTEKTGMNYLQSIFTRPEALEEETIKTILKQASEVKADFNHRDNEWNTVLHWALVGNGYSDSIDKLYPYFPKDFYVATGPHQNDCVINSYNREGITVYDLAKIILARVNITFENHANFDYYSKDWRRVYESYTNGYKWAKEPNRQGRLLNSYFSHTIGYSLRHLGTDSMISFDRYHNKIYDICLSDFAPVFQTRKLKKLGTYHTPETKE